MSDKKSIARELTEHATELLRLVKQVEAIERGKHRGPCSGMDLVLDVKTEAGTVETWTVSVHRGNKHEEAN